jgi:hypothetical protein
VIQIVLLAGFALFAVMALRQFLRSAPAGTKEKWRRTFFWGLIALGLMLAATGRLGILIPVIGALIAAVLRMLPVLIPMLVQFLPLWKRWQQQQQYQTNPPGGMGGGQRTGGAADASTVESKYLRMRLDHATGEIGGLVIAGRHRGRSLSELDRAELGDLYAECVRNDRESAALLKAYSERVYGEDFETDAEPQGASAGGRQAPPSDGRMANDEAYEILGLKPGAKRDDIVAAHRRLMQRLHPDRGGSDYLAAKINKAKDVLLGH